MRVASPRSPARSLCTNARCCMAVEAIRLWDAPTTRRALLDVMGRSPRIVSVTRTSGDVGVQQMSLAPDGSTAVIVDE